MNINFKNIQEKYYFTNNKYKSKINGCTSTLK